MNQKKYQVRVVLRMRDYPYLDWQNVYLIYRDGREIGEMQSLRMAKKTCAALNYHEEMTQLRKWKSK